jgi:hypothetical protein
MPPVTCGKAIFSLLMPLGLGGTARTRFAKAFASLDPAGYPPDLDACGKNEEDQ